MSTENPTCADLNCTTAPHCSIAPSCPLRQDRLTAVLMALADKIDILVVAFAGVAIAVCAAVIVVGGHGEPAAVTLATVLVGFGGGLLAYFRLKAGQTENTKGLKRVEEKTDQAAVEAKAAKVVAADVAAKQEIIGLDVKAAKVAARVSVKQNVDILEATNHKEAAVADARAAGALEERNRVAAVVNEVAPPDIAPTLVAKVMDTRGTQGT